jgi:hypothetical protein
MTDQEASNIRKAIEWVACLTLGDRAGWSHNRCRDVGGRWEHWHTGRVALSRAGLWEERPYPFEPFEDD